MTTKEKVLELLLKAFYSESDEKIVSGEKLAIACGVSRAAVWKAVNALRSEGYAIEGTTNGGYCFSDDDVFTKDFFQRTLDQDFPELAGFHSEIFKEIDSTNTYAKKLLSQAGNLRLPDGTLTKAGKNYHNAIICAESQTAGRGRLGRTFISPAKTGIYLSIIYAPKGGIKDPAKITAFSAVAVCRAVKELYGIECKIKWINDIYLNGKKICGILTEGFTDFETGIIESAIIGIGINIRDNPDFLQNNVSQIAGSIESVISEKAPVIPVLDTGISPKISRCKLAAHIYANVLKILEEDPASIISEYKNASFLIGKTLTVHPLAGSNKDEYSAVAVDIDDNAGLVVELEDGTKKVLSSGEVTLHNTQIN
ncbi:MAG: biotin--[acetyl-CoA-carboxylase] ligase [Treponema sp.]|nr:biotin--[acetyl-CoA-carboxylase] ligase [Treponema sp.]